ncbi:hypothetical protein J3A83DRAFT_4185155 [Scleroderma citrinum]
MASCIACLTSMVASILLTQPASLLGCCPPEELLVEMVLVLGRRWRQWKLQMVVIKDQHRGLSAFPNTFVMNQGVTAGSEISLASLSTSVPFIHLLVTTIMQIEHLCYVTMPLTAIKEKLVIKEQLTIKEETAIKEKTCWRGDMRLHFLLDGAPPLLHPQKLPDNWSLYCNWMEFELANFLFTHAEMPVKKINALLEIWAALMLELGGELLFTNHTDLYHIIDSMCVGDVKWENFTVHYIGDQDNDVAPWMSDMYDV